MCCYFYLLCVLWVTLRAGGLIISENGESKPIEISSIEDKESGITIFVTEKEKQENFNSLTLSEGAKPVHDLNTETKGKSAPALWKMIQKTKSPTKPSWQKTIALTSTAAASQPTCTPKHKSQYFAII